MLITKIKRGIRLLSNNRQFRKEIKRKGGRIHKGVEVGIRGSFEVGNDVVIGAKGIDVFSRSQIILTPEAKLILGNHVGMTSVSIFCKERIEIRDHVNIGAGTLIFDSNFHNTDWNIRRDRIKDVESSQNASVIIENDVFIGARCIIMKGVTIGARSIIAAGSVVCKDIPADCIAGGNPCQVIKRL